MPLALSPNMRGAAFMSLSMAGFTLNDSLAKLISADLNMAQIMLVRGLFATALIVFLAWRQGAFAALPLIWRPIMIVRLVGELGATLCFLLALARMPLGNVSAVMQVLPLAVTMGAAVFYDEPVGWRRWIAIAIGFVGVMIIIRPGFEGFNAYALLALGSVAFCTLRDLATRRIPKEVPTVLVSVATSVAVTIAGLLLIPAFGGWRPMTGTNIVTLAAAGVLLLVGYNFIIFAMRSGEISAVAPFRYTALLWALVVGYLLFGDVPDTAMVAGSIVIVASGLYTLYRERVVGRRLPVANATSPAMAPDGL